MLISPRDIFLKIRLRLPYAIVSSTERAGTLYRRYDFSVTRAASLNEFETPSFERNDFIFSLITASLVAPAQGSPG
jgi:hypothetical protein